MPIRWRRAFVALALLATVAVAAQVVSSRRETDKNALVDARVTVPAGSPSASPGPVLFHSAAGFYVTLPVGWIASDRSEVFNRYSVRLMTISNGTSPTANSAGLIRWDQLPADHVVLELIEFGGPGGSPASDMDSSFPLDWTGARESPDGQGGTALVLRFQHLVRTMALSAHIGPNASTADRQAVHQIVSSIRPERIPSSGSYRGWDVVGPLWSFPVGMVRLFDKRGPHLGGFYLVRGGHTMFAFIDHAYQSMGAMKPCPIRYETASRTFLCEATLDRWSRTGAQLTGGGLFTLSHHAVVIKDGLVLVGGGSTSTGGRAPAEADEFSDPAALPAAGAPPTRREILDRYAKITTTSPIERAAAKLVSREVALASEVIRGAFIGADIEKVWVVAFRGQVRIAGSTEPHGRWTVFYVDAASGGAVTMACCGGGEWPPGFDPLPDQAPDEN